MRIVTGMVAGVAAVLISASAGLAADPTREERGRVAKLPQTADDHAALAKTYDDRAAEWQREATYHREMAAAYKKAHPDTKDAVAMEKHCAKVAKEAGALAEEAMIMADYHRIRAKAHP